MSKERLKEIKRNWKKDYEFVDIGNEKLQFDKDFAWLIKQAERSIELEKKLYAIKQSVCARVKNALEDDVNE